MVILTIGPSNYISIRDSQDYKLGLLLYRVNRFSRLSPPESSILDKLSPLWLSGKESACNAEELDSVPGLGRSPGGGHGNPLQYSCLKNPHEQIDWRTTVHGVRESDTIGRLSTAQVW